MMTIYENKVKAIGDHAQDFLAENMFILFGEGAPIELKDYCYRIDIVPTKGEIKVGQKLEIDEQIYEIIGVGNLVKRNLESMGHISINLNGCNNNDKLPGTLYLEKKEMPSIKIGSKIKIIE